MNFMRDANVVAGTLASLGGSKSIIHTGPAWEQINRLPVEVLSEIFLLVMKSWFGNNFFCGLPPPIQLARVCRAWRQIAFSTPLLWAFIRIVLPTKKLDVYEELLREWIARSAGCPLHLKIFGDDLSPQACMKDFRPIFTLLLQSRNRWMTLVTRDFQDLLAVMLDAKCDFPSLRDLHIFSTGRRRALLPSPWPFNYCPQLRKLTTSLKHSHILVDWNTIEELSLTVNIAECLSYLNSSARTIKNYDIELQDCWNRNIHGLSYNMISLPCATTLSICVGDIDSRSDVFTLLLARLSLPVLKDLKIVVGENIYTPWIPEFIRLISRSSWKLLKLDITAHIVEGASEVQILEILFHLPTLEYLSLAPQCEFSPKFFAPMDLSKTPAREALLPALRVLEMCHQGSCTIYTALIRMLESRIPSDIDNNSLSSPQRTLPTVQQLLSVKIEAIINTKKEQDEYRTQAQLVKAKIPSLESKGTKLVINCFY